MASTDITPIVARMVALLEAIPDIGRVLDHEVWDRDDFGPQVTSIIDGVPVMRAWIITGPTLADAAYFTQAQPANAIMRAWQYRIIGIEGLDADASGSTGTQRDQMVAVLDALDADRQMGGTAHRTEVARVDVGPQLRLVAQRYACSYVEITKVVVTVSSP